MTWWVWVIIGFDILLAIVSEIIFIYEHCFTSWLMGIIVFIVLLIFGIPILLFGIFSWVLQNAMEK